MISLAWIEVTRTDGQTIPLRIADIRSPIHPMTGGAQISLVGGGAPLEVSETPTAVYTKINTKWTEWTTALGDPA